MFSISLTDGHCTLCIIDIFLVTCGLLLFSVANQNA